MDANLKEMKEEMIASLDVKVDANLREIKAVIRTNQERMETKIEVNNKKFEALQGTLLSRTDAHQSRIEVMMEATDLEAPSWSIRQSLRKRPR
jgi:hypothetical protein